MSAIWNGGVAQLGERLLCKQEVDGSSPFTSTSLAKPDWRATGETAFRRKPPRQSFRHRPERRLAMLRRKAGGSIWQIAADDPIAPSGSRTGGGSADGQL
jgi:hypothetical protein